MEKNVRSLFNSVISDLDQSVHSESSKIKDGSEMSNRDKPLLRSHEVSQVGSKTANEL